MNKAITQYLNFMFDYFEDDSRLRTVPYQMLRNVFMDFYMYNTSDYIIDKYLKIDITRMVYLYKRTRNQIIEYVLSNPNDAKKEIEDDKRKEIRLQTNSRL